MPHDISLITTVATGLGLALVLGFVVARLGIPPLVGYLIAGIIIGPATPGFVADVQLTGQLAEIGVMLMMFGIGLQVRSRPRRSRWTPKAWSALAVTLVKIAAFVAFMLLVARRLLPHLLWLVADTSEAAVLIQAHVARASMLVIATPDTRQMRRMVEIARTLNPKIDVLLRTHSDEEAALLRQQHLGMVFMGEHELALAMTRQILTRMERQESAAET